MTLEAAITTLQLSSQSMLVKASSTHPPSTRPKHGKAGKGWLTRRLADETFLLLHEAAPLSALTLQVVELPALPPAAMRC